MLFLRCVFLVSHSVTQNFRLNLINDWFHCMWFEVFTVFVDEDWSIWGYDAVVNSYCHFRGAFCLHLQGGQRISCGVNCCITWGMKGVGEAYEESKGVPGSVDPYKGHNPSCVNLPGGLLCQFPDLHLPYIADCIWNVMAHAQKPGFVFRRNRRVRFNRRGHQFGRLLAAEACASAIVMLDTPCSEVVRRVLATHSIFQFPLHFPSRVSLRAITFQLDSTTVSSMQLTPLGQPWRWRLL